MNVSIVFNYAIATATHILSSGTIIASVHFGLKTKICVYLHLLSALLSSRFGIKNESLDFEKKSGEK